MEELKILVESILVPHWPFLTWVTIAILMGQVMKNAVWTIENARKNAVYWWGRKTLALHPVVGGLLLGTLWRNPSEGVDTLIESMGYFGLAGASSVFIYEVVKGMAKKRGYELSLDGIDN